MAFFAEIYFLRIPHEPGIILPPGRSQETGKGERHRHGDAAHGRTVKVPDSVERGPFIGRGPDMGQEPGRGLPVRRFDGGGVIHLPREDGLL